MDYGLSFKVVKGFIYPLKPKKYMMIVRMLNRDFMIIHLLKMVQIPINRDCLIICQ